VVFAGRFAASKGMGLLGRLVPRLLATPGRRFVFAGGHGDPQGSAVVRDLVRRFPGACENRGWLPPGKLEELLAEASLVVVPSRYEPFGMVALEAQRQGAPVLAAAVGGLPEVVGEDSGGKLVSGRRDEDWRAASEEILTSPPLSARLRRRGPRWVEERFHIDRVAHRLEEAYAA
jgi:glycosyltransferase involved in cell wall biosynthesis